MAKYVATANNAYLKSNSQTIVYGETAVKPVNPITYRTENRNRNWPYVPLPSEIHAQDTENNVIYYLYKKNDEFCIPNIYITYTGSLDAKIYKYYNTNIVSQETANIISNTPYQIIYTNNDADWNDWNYALLVVKGNITRWNWQYYITYDGTSQGDSSGNNLNLLIEMEAYFNTECVYYYTSQTNRPYSFCEYFGWAGNINYTKYNGIFQLNSTFVNLKAITELDISNATNVGNAFNCCYALVAIPNIDLSNATQTNSMFQNCYALETIPEINISKSTNASNMFSNCYNLKHIPQLNTANVTNMQGMFYNCYNLSSIQLLNTSKVTNIASMFLNCLKIKEFPLFDFSKVTNATNAFYSCVSIQEFPQFNFSSLVTGTYTFCYCTCEHLPLFTFGSLTKADRFLQAMPKLKEIPAWDWSTVTDNTNSLYNLQRLEKVHLQHIRYSLAINNPYVLFTKEAILEILNNLDTVSTTQTLTLGAININRLTAEEKAIATNKGWTLA